MGPEIIEALKEYYDDEPDILADCILFLKQNSNNVYLNKACSDALSEMKRCEDCGTELQIAHYCEHHPEVDGGMAYEYYADLFCPNCDVISPNAKVVSLND